MYCAVLSCFSCVQLFGTCSLADFSVHGILQARILEWFALLQGIFLTQGSNLCLSCLLHWQASSLQVPPGRPLLSLYISINENVWTLYIWWDFVVFFFPFFFLLGSWSQPGFLQVNTSDSELMFQSSFVLEIEWQEPFVWALRGGVVSWPWAGH